MVRSLIVDDSLLIRKQLRDILSSAGHDVVGEARDGLCAPELVRELHPDLVTLDLIMPGRHGMETLRHLLQVDPSLIVVVCSASLDQPRVIKALRLGAKGFIVKPFDEQQVLDAVRGALGPTEAATPHTEPGNDPATASSSADDSSPPAPRPDDPAPRPDDPAPRPDDPAPRPDDPALRPDAPQPDGPPIEHIHGICAGLVVDLQAILDGAVAAHSVTLEQILSLEYQELRGPLIGGLGRLFDVRRVPDSGFTPPKFQTPYDAVVDRQLMEPMDAVLGAEPWLTFAVPLDLNVYAPAHNSAFTRNYSGDAAQDLSHNRTKRFFLDSLPLLHAARMQLGVDLPPRKLSRAEIARAGGQLDADLAGGAHAFQVETYTRDTGAVLKTLSVPLFVQGQRWGVVTVGWDPGRQYSRPDCAPVAA